MQPMPDDIRATIIEQLRERQQQVELSIRSLGVSYPNLSKPWQERLARINRTLEWLAQHVAQPPSVQPDSNGLLSCPFCGGEAELREVGLLPDYGYVVGCTNCDGQVGDTDEPWIQAGYAIAAWNTRTATARQEDAP